MKYCQRIDFLKPRMMRIGKPRDVGELAYFLSGSGAEFITGQVIGVNGGFVV